MNERLTELTDQAQQREQELISDALASVPKPPEERSDIDDDYECDQCGATHPEFHQDRYKRGYDICVSCQQDIEKANKGYNRRKTHYSDFED